MNDILKENFLYIAESTVKKHVYNIYNKSNLSSRFELISYLSRSYIRSISEAS